MKKDPFAHIADQELLDRYYADRNNEWLGVLLQRYTLLLLGVCMKYMKNEEEAKDCVQQIFVKIITELPKYKVEFFKSWIYTIARNHCLMKLRDRHGREPLVLTDTMTAAWDEDPGKRQHLEKDQLLDLMGQSLEELGNDQKSCVILFYLEKRSYQEIAGTTGYTLMQVKSHIQNGKRNLKLLMEKKAREKTNS
ncbi:MAG TPA: sigma-70 family RNA polymerase sigma factor [Puia sp.]|nr:sigma-70 family RNA polymerase sigma factor [Puia sp.]